MNQKSDAPDWSSYKLGWEDGVMAERQSHRQTHLHTAPVDAVNTSQERVDEIVKQEHDKQIEIAQAYERGWNAALAQQEPVAWISDSPTRGNGRQLHWTKAEAWKWSSNITPLFIAPPSHNPLTDEEIFEVHKRVDSMQYLTFARAIEAAHGIGEKA